MQTWYFSQDGKITGPLGLSDAQKLITKHPDIYAWNPDYPTWVPVSNIDELNSEPKIPKPPTDVPSSLYDDFIAEEKAMLENLSRIESTLASTLTSLGELNIEAQVKKTKNLNVEVKETISKVEQQIAALERSIADVAQS